MSALFKPSRQFSGLRTLQATAACQHLKLAHRPSNSRHLHQTASLTSNSGRSPGNQNPSYPAFKFSDLGANRAVKITVYSVIGILGTIETIFYVKVGWRYFRGDDPAQDSEPSDDSD